MGYIVWCIWKWLCSIRLETLNFSFLSRVKVRFWNSVCLIYWYWVFCLNYILSSLNKLSKSWLEFGNSFLLNKYFQSVLYYVFSLRNFTNMKQYQWVFSLLFAYKYWLLFKQILTIKHIKKRTHSLNILSGLDGRCHF